MSPELFRTAIVLGPHLCSIPFIPISRTKRQRKDTQASASLATERVSDAEASESDAKTRPKRARPKKSTRVRAGRTGKLRQMLDMPLEVTLEICAHLHPQDVLNLSRASKDLRAFFLSRNSMSIWKMALSNPPGLPPCPDDLSEPAYVNLMFSLQCHVCLNKNCQDVYWLNRLRLCDGCRKQTETSGPEAFIRDADAREMIKPHKLADLVPPLRYLYKCDRYPQYFRPALEEFFASLRKTPQAEREEFLRTRVEHIESRRKGAPNLREYHNAMKSSRTNELDKQKVDRRDQIVERLKQAGYEKETDYLFTRNKTAYNEFIMLPEVRKAQALTPRIWKNIQERIFSFIELVKESRLHDDRCSTLTARLDALHECMKRLIINLAPRQASTLEVAYNIPEVGQILDPHVENFDCDKLEKTLKETVSTYIENRNTRYRQELSTKIRKWLGLEASADPLALAVASSLRCTSCANTFTQIGALQHCCARNADYCPTVANRHDMTNEFRNVLMKWSIKQGQPVVLLDPSWEYFDHGIRVAAAVISQCGFDPKSVSPHDMDEANARFLCPRHHYYAPVMDWRAVIHHNRSSRCQFRRATEEEISAVRPLEARLEQEQREISTYRCGHCENLCEVTKETVDVHLRNVHGITEPHEDDCIDLRTKLPPPRQTYLLLPQKKGHPGSHAFAQEVLDKGIGIYFDYSNGEEETS